MDTSQLKENPLMANCFFINQWSYDRHILEGIVKAEEVIVDGKTWYDPHRAYCSMAKEKPEDFRQACPNWVNCPYVNGEARDVKPGNAE
ncbi:hypothetical protein KY331_06000 [Candidatus Woesearchaeota archaeon]|nr:hypothetical protein [Candidatus Woesearchaeota archaeon]